MSSMTATYSLLFRGAAIGTIRFQFAELFGGGELVPLPGFERVRSELVDASRALTNYGFLPPGDALVGSVDPPGDVAGASAFARAQAFCDDMELRDEMGRLVSTDWINIFGGRTADEPFTVMATFDHAPAGAPARAPQEPKRDSGAESG